jgi:hypothetical protein
MARGDGGVYRPKYKDVWDEIRERPTWLISYSVNGKAAP